MYITQQVLVGNRVWMTENNVTVLDDVDDQLRKYEIYGQTVVLVAINGEFACLNTYILC